MEETNISILGEVQEQGAAAQICMWEVAGHGVMLCVLYPWYDLKFLKALIINSIILSQPGLYSSLPPLLSSTLPGI